MFFFLILCFAALPLGYPWLALVIILLFCLAAATFVSHTVASLILMPVIATLGIDLGMPEVAVIGSAFAGTYSAPHFLDVGNVRPSFIMDCIYKQCLRRWLCRFLPSPT